MIRLLKIKRLRLLTILVYFSPCLLSQPTAGTSGLLNIPTADMQPDGTFSTGINFLPDILTPQPEFDYNTFNYYFGMAFLPFIELSYRMTLLENSGEEFKNQQDRSLAVRVRLIKEGKVLPAIVVGGNDILRTLPESNTQHFISSYIAATKTLETGKIITRLTLGYAPDFFQGAYFSGIFGGLSISPAFLKSFSFDAEYDTKNFNAGLTLLLFRHLYFYSFAINMKQITGGFAIRLYPRLATSPLPHSRE